jgi:hypothetical protein
VPSHSDRGFEHVTYSVKSVPCILTIKQKEHHLSVTTNYPKDAEMDQNFTKGFITHDETCLQYDPETKSQSSQLKSPRSPRPKKKVQQVHSKVKIMLIFLFDMEGVEQNRTE